MEKFNNAYLKKCDFDNIDLWKLQQSIEENALVMVEFEGDATIVITKNQIYVDKWKTGFMPVDYFEYWNNDDRYNIRDYIILERNCFSDIDYDSYWGKILKKLVEKGNYTLNYGKKEDILSEIEQFWS